MKKAMALFLFLTMVSAPAFAEAVMMGPDAMRQEHRAELIQQRKARGDSGKPAAQASGNKEPGFWQKEGERSGLSNSGNRINQFFSALNPAPFFQDQEKRYNERKIAGKTSATK